MENNVEQLNEKYTESSSLNYEIAINRSLINIFNNASAPNEGNIINYN